MAIIKAGTYVFVEEPTITKAYNQTLNYKVHYLTAENVYATDTYDTVRLSVNVRFGGSIMLREANTTDFPVTGYTGNTKQWKSSLNESSGNLTATDNTKLRTIIVETDQTVADDFHTWFTSNTALQPKLSIDLTTLPGWANLSTGNHTIKIKAKGTGYTDSELSAGVVVSKAAQAYTDCLTFTGESSEFTLKATNKEWDGTLQWSTDHNTWTTLTGTEEMQSVNKKLYLRGKGNTKFCQSGNYKGVRWQLSAKAGCSGNIQTLLDYENPPTSIPADYCYRNMFYDCTNLTSAPELPATTLTKYCYYNMFSSCTNLTTTPKLPATALASYCYEYMFTYCSNLITAPELLATTLKPYCYAFMFEGCTKLKVNTSSGNKIFTCPSDIPIMAVNNMFGSTGGSFTGEPTSGNTYYWTE